MEFKKYSSIENRYQQKFINSFAEKFGLEALKEPFIVSEKFDGANIQIVFSPYQKIKVGKRTSYLEMEDDFFDIWNTLNKYNDACLWCTRSSTWPNQAVIDTLQNLSDMDNKIIIVYGEIFGEGINNRIDYGKGKYIRFFDMIRDNEFIPQSEFIRLFQSIKLDYMLPPYIITSSLAEALEIEIPEGREGFIIQPLNNVRRLNSGSRFILKKKSPKFDDIILRKKEENKTDDRISLLNLKFRDYINDNRLTDLFSKYGKIKESKQIADYIKLLIKDAKDDFLKDNDISDIDQKEQKDIFNVGSIGLEMIKRNLI